jgi:hypothetical protein
MIIAGAAGDGRGGSAPAWWFSQHPAELGETRVTQAGRDPSGAAAELGDGTGAGGQHGIGERGEHRPVQRQAARILLSQRRILTGFSERTEVTPSAQAMN